MERDRPNATYEDILNAPEDKIAELLGGDLYISPRPAIRHLHATSMLGARLISAQGTGGQGSAGWWILDEPELHLERDVFVPDLAGWRRSRLPELPDEPAFTMTPDWVCEVLSPSTATHDRNRKLPLYAFYGIECAWLIDPSARRLEVFRRQRADWELVKLASGSDEVFAYPFEDVSIRLDTLWAGRPS